MHDTEIRNHLHAVFDATGIGYVDEVTFGDRRIDMAAMLDGVLTGIEIKSAKDSLKRLPGQKRRFRSRFRQLVMVTEQNHLAGVLAGLPPWWGIWVASEADGVVTLDYLRAPRDPQKAQAYLLAQALWLAELETELGLKPGGSLRKPELVELLVEQGPERVEAALLAAIQARKSASRLAGFVS